MEAANKPEPWTTTMAAIYAHRPCTDGWEKLRRHTGLPATDARIHEIKGDRR